MASSVAELIGARRRASIAAAAVLVVAVAAVLVLVGRWEHRREVRGQVRGMARVLALIGPLDQPSLSGYRRLPGMDCLVYRRGANPYALELCADPVGRVEETIDRRTFDRRISSLRFDPRSSTLRVDRAEVDRLLRRMGAGGS